jgi:nucleoside-diphosphate-sugar epimerase
MTESTATTFLTGATGFLGQFVLRDLLARGRRVLVLVRPPVERSAHRLSNLLRPIGEDIDEHLRAGRLRLIPGLLPDELPDVNERVDDIIHSAASLRLLRDGDEPYRTNVDGTEAMIRWAERHDVPSFHHVSTAYVCGLNRECVPEEFHPRPEVQTDYELSKWRAEEALRAWAARDGRRLTVFRPSFLMGDSHSGFTSQFGGFYQFAHFVYLLKQHHRNGNNGELTYIPLRIPGRAEERIQNLVTVDFAARVIAEVADDPDLHGRIYHLTDPEPPTWDFLKRAFEQYFNMTGGYYVDPGELAEERSAAETLMWSRIELLMPRIRYTPRFEQPNTREVIRRKAISYPKLDEALFFRLLDYAVDNGWGRRRNGMRR